MALRLGVTFAAALVIGLERESHGRAAGLRTTLLASLAAAAAMIMSELIYAPVSESDGWRPDPARLAAGVLAGMGFLGAGAIIKDGNSVRGVTTAATLWSVSILGLIFGGGEFVLGLLLWALLVVTLLVLPYLEVLVKNDWYGWLEVRCAMDGFADEEIRVRLEKNGLRIKRTMLSYDFERGERRMRFELKFKSRPLYELSHQIMDDLRGMAGIREVRWE
jgi:putative Mg2+ transporter-C (MgtC) family protein